MHFASFELGDGLPSNLPIDIAVLFLYKTPRSISYSRVQWSILLPFRGTFGRSGKREQFFSFGAKGLSTLTNFGAATGLPLLIYFRRNLASERVQILPELS
jgi:hypothetical protein